MRRKAKGRQIVCYGIGGFEDRGSRKQLAVLIAMNRNGQEVEVEHKKEDDIESVVALIEKATLTQSASNKECVNAAVLQDGTKRDTFAHLAGSNQIQAENSVLVFDPVHNVRHAVFLRKEYHIETIERNEQCKRKVEEKTLFYMPKCDQQLVANVIEANLEQLGKITIVGNSVKEWLTKIW